MRTKLLVTSGALVLAFAAMTGCSSVQRGAAAGGALGAVAGGVVGHNVAAVSVSQGAAMGGATGAATGGLAGDAYEQMTED
ncbi:hypothetical protein HZA57_01850, partial [Candidatus Poribacteria bacterium]|nr:hypothetical protein [Candidatus Poribacteria bacterium]